MKIKNYKDASVDLNQKAMALNRTVAKLKEQKHALELEIRGKESDADALRLAADKLKRLSEAGVIE